MATGPVPPNSAGIVTGGAGLSGALTGTPNASGQRVYMGQEFRRIGYTPMTGNPTTVAAYARGNVGQTMMNPDSAAALWPWLDPQLKARAYVAAARVYAHDKSPDITVAALYKDAVTGSMQSSLILGRPVSVWEQLQVMGDSAEQMRAAAGIGGSGGGGGGGAGGGPSTTVQYNLSSESDAAVLVDQALNQYLGRQATPKERDKFWGVLTKAQMRNPNVSQSSGGQNPSVVQSGGLNASQAAKEFALSRKDAAEYMANTQYTDWLLEKAANDQTEGIASGL